MKEKKQHINKTASRHAGVPGHWLQPWRCLVSSLRRAMAFLRSISARVHCRATCELVSPAAALAVDCDPGAGWDVLGCTDSAGGMGGGCAGVWLEGRDTRDPAAAIETETETVAAAAAAAAAVAVLR